VSAQGGRIVARRWECAVDTRDRQVGEATLPNPNSDHSLIPAAAIHHERVTASDLAIGHPISSQAEYSGWMDYLRAVADWRTDWADLEESAGNPRLSAAQRTARQRMMQQRDTPHPPEAKDLIAATEVDRQTGVMPRQVDEVTRIGLVTAQTTDDRVARRAPEQPFRPPRRGT